MTATNLEGRGVVITGGGRGIGAAVARAMAQAGARVVVAARTTAQIEQVASELRDQGHAAWAVPCDVTDPEQIQNLIEKSVEHLGRVDILVNNAGVAPSAPIQKQKLEDWNRVLAINTTSAFLCTQAVLPAMVEAKWGRVINIASVASLSGARYIGAYAASKHALLGLTRCAAAEVAAKGITVNALCPGYVDTSMTDASIDRIVNKTGMDENQAKGAVVSMNPQKRLISPEEVAFMALTLCHPQARGINGQAIVIDGGALLS